MNKTVLTIFAAIGMTALVIVALIIIQAIYENIRDNRHYRKQQKLHKRNKDIDISVRCRLCSTALISTQQHHRNGILIQADACPHSIKELP